MSTKYTRAFHILPVWIWFILVALLTRIPYFFKIDIDWDESTFLLLGQSVLKGQLPYTGDVIDVKAPLLWYCFAVLTALTGKSFFFVRFAGAMITAMSGYLIYFCISKVWGQNRALIAGFGLVIFINLSAGGQALISEHLVIIPLLLAFLCCLFYRRQIILLYCAGVCMTIASMIRLNLAYSMVILGLYLCVLVLNNSSLNIQKKLLNICSYAAGCISILILTIMPYILSHNIPEFYRGLIQSSLSYANQQSSFFIVLKEQIIYYIAGSFKTSIALLLLHLFVAIICGAQLRLLLSNSNELNTLEKRLLSLICVFWISIEFSILKSGVFWGHYNMQLAGFVVIFITPTVYNIIQQNQMTAGKLFLFLTLSVYGIHTGLQYSSIGNNFFCMGSLFYGPSYQLAQELDKELGDREPNDKSIWLANHHFYYWQQNINPPISSTTHPSNIHKEFLLRSWFGEQSSTVNELKKIIASPPEFIEGKRMETYFQTNPEAQQLLNSFLQEKYSEIPIDNLKTKIYRLNK
ncbi:hypothetical protein Lepto7376_1988 [[Leptolyngbya] sp. PCC 7376]|uniref:ArnT family glycosyltransferase n=1 Tax=[Leptolyngbya] sp. PCC 7376 TaxID=111781 RepID=UPI00029EF409|nr:hypothetical protein [[Leptolyngbya] sp. PCC 7376]AFY38298.1 hypothetical protein Lepto7376_1988 [[Leptolyngbya] sp. PCC 7376]